MNYLSELNTIQIILVMLVAILIGMAKTGVHGAGMLAVPLLAIVFGGQLSSGIILPMLLLADVFGVWYYHRHASWNHLKILFPWAAAGVVLGVVVGNYINDQIFKIIMAFTIVISLILMVWLEHFGSSGSIPNKKSFAATIGITGGFTSMVGNLAGSVMSVYLLSMRLPKNAFIGTTAWFFLVVNAFKLPFHVFAWHTIGLNTAVFGLITLPLIVLGAWLGIATVRQLSDSAYRWFIIVMTLVAAVGMLL
ncbi:MAG: sulfite exporter TauE/SafE family protein [Cyclobacteriaceae bacterium]|nr:sulfite exporter TauE/SafE family protein [Cyclobacteriaceae bacterium]